MVILIRVYSDPEDDAPLNPEELIVCDEYGDVMYFNNADDADAYREKHAIDSQIYSLN